MRLRSFLAAMAAILLLAVPASAHTREEVRASYQAISDWTEGGLFAASPRCPPLTPPAKCARKPWKTRLDYLNFLRYLAGLGCGGP